MREIEIEFKNLLTENEYNNLYTSLIKTFIMMMLMKA